MRPIFGDTIGHAFTGRGIDALEKKIGAGIIDAVLAATSRAAAASPSVLEIGCGEGRVLMELRARHPHIRIAGVNDYPWPAMRGSDSLPAVAKFFGIPEAAVEPPVPLPTIHFCDAAELPFESEQFDLIVSQAAMPLMRRKDRVIEEVVRMLRPGGEAHLHLDSTTRERGEATPRFAIAAADGPRSVVDHLIARCGEVAAVRQELVDIDGGGCFTILRLRKLRSGTIDLRLVPEEAGSGWEVSVRWGCRSVFRLLPSNSPPQAIEELAVHKAIARGAAGVLRPSHEAS